MVFLEKLENRLGYFPIGPAIMHKFFVNTRKVAATD